MPRQDDAWENPQAFGNAELAGLVGWWKFDETQGKTAKDSSGGNHNGTLVGNAKWGQGKIGGAVDAGWRMAALCGLPTSPLLTSPAPDQRLPAGCNIRSVPAEWMAIVTKGDNAWRLSTIEPGKKNFISRSTTGTVRSINGATTVNPTNGITWRRFTTAVPCSLYVDGKLDATQPWTAASARTTSMSSSAKTPRQQGRCFDGLIDDVRIYNYALSESEIKALAAGQ